MTVPLRAQPRRRVVDLATPCKICASPSLLFDVVDFNEDSYTADGRRMALAGVPVYYYRCPGFGFLFTRDFDDWDAGSLPDLIAATDPSGAKPEPAERGACDFTPLLKQWFGQALGRLRLLDLSEAESAGPSCALDDKEGPYDVILAFNIFESLTDPLAFMSRIDRIIVRDGLLLVATPLNDGVDPVAADVRRRPLRYVSPRRGQFSIYNAASLALVLGSAGFRLGGFRQGIHIGVRTLPSYALTLFGDSPSYRLQPTLSSSR